MPDRCLYESDVLAVSEFDCPLDDAAWSSTNRITLEAPLVVFPRVPVVITRPGGSAVLATPNVAMLYRPGALYDREARHPRGDSCLYVELRDPSLYDDLPRATHLPTGASAYLRQHLLGRYLRDGDVDPLVVESVVLGIVGDVAAAPQPPRPRRHTTAEAHERLVADAQELIAATVAERLTVHAIARRLGTSPFHLVRVFRGRTGFGIHEYRNELRLRLALERLHEQAGDLARLGLELGFTSHSHFTDAFRRRFGVPPSAVARRHAGELLSAA